jgi:hypothetical protein
VLPSADAISVSVALAWNAVCRKLGSHVIVM